LLATPLHPHCWRRPIRLGGLAVGLRPAAEAFDKIRGGHAKPFGKLDHTASADPVGPSFVLLHLLKRDSRRRSKFGLAQAHF
jgi:hypothetical protein